MTVVPGYIEVMTIRTEAPSSLAYISNVSPMPVGSSRSRGFNLSVIDIAEEQLEPFQKFQLFR